MIFGSGATAMKTLLAALALVAATMLCGTSARAQNYAWCAQYGGHNIASTNCGFASFEQCRATISGIGGSCYPNPQYQPLPGTHPRRRYPH
jgi:hypothetical protein